MPGALIQMIAVGVQDIHLTGDPTTTMFKKKLPRITNFAVESIEQTISGGTPNMSVTISRNGDLIYGVWFEISIKKGAGNCNYPAEQFIKEIQLEIGGQKIDTIDSDWLSIRRELFLDIDRRESYHEMNNFRVDDPVGMIKKFYVKIPFFFTEDMSKALPLVSLQYHEVKLNITTTTEIPGVDTTFSPQVKCFVDYVFLDSFERTLFAQNGHEYLIEQTQIQTASTPVSQTQKQYRVMLNFNHPVRYLVWASKTNTHGSFSASEKPFEPNDNYAPFSTCGLQFNGTDRFRERDGSYFRFVQPYDAVSKTPSAGIYMYSFGVDNRTNENTGTMNFSRVDNATLILKTKSAGASSISNVFDSGTTISSAINAIIGVKVFACNYNVLKIQSGMAGLLYSN